MELILLNAEETLLIERAGRPAEVNGRFFRCDTLDGEALRFTFLSSGKACVFVCHRRFLQKPAPPFSVWKGGETVFLYVSPQREYGEGVQTKEGAVLSPLGNFPYSARTALKNGNALYRFTPEEHSNRGGAAALISADGKTLFYGLVDEVTVSEDRFLSVRRFPTHRAHQTETVRSADTGEALSYRAYPTRHTDPVKIPPFLTPVLFMEEVVFRACPEDFLCRALHERKKDFFGFFGDVLFALPYKEGALLFSARGGVERAFFSVREGLIYDVSVEDLPADFVLEDFG